MQSFSRRKNAICVLLFAFSSILSATPRMVLSTLAIGPLYVTPGTNGPLQTVQASNAGDGTLTVTTTSSASWLAASVGTPAACASQSGACVPISVSLNTASLATGSYTEYLTVTSPGAIDSPEQISVNVVVANVPGSITLYAAPNGGTASVSVYPQSPIVGVVATQSGGNWLGFGQPAGGPFGTPYPITVTTQPGQIPGTYNGTVSITGSTFQPDNQTINVALNVTTNPIIQVNNQNVLMRGYAGGPPVTAVVSLSNVGLGTLTITGAVLTSATNNVMSVSVTSANSITILADTSQVFAAGLYTGTVTIRSNAANSSLVSIPVELTVSRANTPTIYQSGIVNIANFQADTSAPGDIVSIFGDQFTAVGASFTNPANTAPVPGIPPAIATNLGGVQVLVNGVAAPLYLASRQQINFQMPYEAVAGQVSTVQVTANNLDSNIRSIGVAATAPRILVWPQSTVQGNYGIVVNSDNSISLPPPGIGLSTRISKPGDIITIYCVGLGQTTPSAVTGVPASSIPLLAIPNVTATFGTSTNPVQAQAVFAGLTPTLVGLYQVNVTIPPNAPIGNNVPLTITINNTNSNVVNMAIASS
jgi:uncharacterized protein (TIGR03437 family)